MLDVQAELTDWSDLSLKEYLEDHRSDPPPAVHDLVSELLTLSEDDLPEALHRARLLLHACSDRTFNEEVYQGCWWDAPWTYLAREVGHQFERRLARDTHSRQLGGVLNPIYLEACLEEIAPASARVARKSSEEVALGLFLRHQLITELEYVRLHECLGNTLCEHRET